jgi:hypothetical protein
MVPHVELVHKSDNRFGLFITKNMELDARRCRGRTKDPIAADHEANLRTLEAATLKWLTTFGNVTTELVLLYDRGHHSQLGEYVCLETDFVIGTPDYPDRFGELKISGSPREAMRWARKQLRKRVEIGSRRWPHVKALCICIWMPFKPGDDAWHDKIFDVSDIGSIVSDNLADRDMECYVFSGIRIMETLIKADLLTAEFPAQIFKSFDLMRNPLANHPLEIPGFALSSAFDSIVDSD